MYIQFVSQVYPDIHSALGSYPAAMFVTRLLPTVCVVLGRLEAVDMTQVFLSHPQHQRGSVNQNICRLTSRFQVQYAAPFASATQQFPQRQIEDNWPIPLELQTHTYAFQLLIAPAAQPYAPVINISQACLTRERQNEGTAPGLPQGAPSCPLTTPMKKATVKATSGKNCIVM